MGAASGALIGIAGLQLLHGQQQIDNEEEAAFSQSESELNELQRQSVERDKMAEEERSDRVREADQRFASIYAAMADGGGRAQIGAFAAENSVVEAIDLSRIEGNRRADRGSLAASALGVQRGWKDTRKRAEAAHVGSMMDFGFAATGVALQHSARAAEVEETKQRGVT